MRPPSQHCVEWIQALTTDIQQILLPFLHAITHNAGCLLDHKPTAASLYVLCSRVAFTYIRLSAYIKWPHYCLSSVPVLFCCCLLLTLRVIVSFPVDSSHVSLGASLFSAAPSRLRLKTGALSSHHTLLIYGWILLLGRRVKRITEQNEIKENSVRVWPAIMTVSMLNASFSWSQSIELEHTVPAFIDVYADDVYVHWISHSQKCLFHSIAILLRLQS